MTQINYKLTCYTKVSKKAEVLQTSYIPDSQTKAQVLTHIHNCRDHLLKFKPEQYTRQFKVMPLEFQPPMQVKKVNGIIQLQSSCDKKFLKIPHQTMVHAASFRADLDSL
jgi:hypothetical protein